MSAYSTYSDEQLVALLKKGDEYSLEVLYARYWQDLYSSALKVLNDQAVCKDIIQELFINVWQRREQLDVKISLKGYLFTAVRYQVLKEIRRSNDSKFFTGLDEKISYWTGDSGLLMAEIQQAVNETIEKLPEGCRKIYVLSREQDLTHAEIAYKLGISTKTVANQLTKALRQIRTSLAHLWSLFILVFFA